MPPKIKLFLAKRAYFKSQIVKLAYLLDNNSIDKITLRLRSTRLTEIYQDVEKQNIELMTIDSRDTHTIEFDELQERYYALMTRVEESLQVANQSVSSIRTTSVESRSDPSPSKRMKLPDVKLPTFDGQYECWLTFKNAFRNMVDTRSELSDIDKLHYLKSALTGDAANKINIFSVDSVNYQKAWDVLI